jgi:hypothetical protein
MTPGSAVSAITASQFAIVKLAGVILDSLLFQ